MVGCAIEGIEQRAADGLLHKEVAGCPDRNEFDTDPSTESEQHDRKGDRHPLPAAQDLVEVRVSGLVVVVDVAAKAETVVDERSESLDIPRGTDAAQVSSSPRCSPMSTVAPGRNDATHSKASSSGTEPGSEKKAESRSGRRTLARYPRYGPSCAAPVPAYEPPVGFAHRGGAGAHPENTERAFRHAVELGYRYLETDVHATADGVLMRPRRQARPRDRPHRTDHRPHVGRGLRSGVAGTDPILRFDEMLQRFPEARINIDPKAETAVEPLADLILHYGVQDRCASRRSLAGEPSG